MSSARRSTVTLHMVSSLDGFIAKKDNSISWMDSPGDVYEKGVAADGAEVLQSIDCYVLGSRAYEHALQLGWRYGDTPTVVVASRQLPSTRKSVEFYCGDLKRLVGEIVRPLRIYSVTKVRNRQSNNSPDVDGKAQRPSV